MNYSSSSQNSSSSQDQYQDAQFDDEGPTEAGLTTQQEEQIIKQRLKALPYELLIKHRQQQIQNKLHANSTQFQVKPSKGSKIQKTAENQPNLNVGQTSTNEIYIHNKPSRKFKPIFESRKKACIDPRFQDYTGQLNRQLAQKSMAFIEDIEQRQLKEIRKRLKRKRVKGQEREDTLKKLNVMTSNIKQRELAAIRKQALAGLTKPAFHPKRAVFKAEAERIHVQKLGKKAGKLITKKKQRLEKKMLISRKKFSAQGARFQAES